MGQEPTPAALRVFARWGYPLPPLAGGSPDDPPGDPAPPSDPPPADPPAPPVDPPADPKVFDEAYVKDLRSEAAGYRTQLNDVKSRLQEFEDRDKTAEQKLTEERDGLKAKVPTLEQENLRLRVAIDKKLPPELVDRLRGTTKEELEADADQLLTLVKAPSPGGWDGGRRGDPAPPALPDDADPLARIAHAYGNK